MSPPFLSASKGLFVFLVLCLHCLQYGDSDTKLSSCSALEMLVRSQGQNSLGE